jgi:hypothetical protein
MEAAGIGEYTTTVSNPIVNDGAGMPVPSFRKGAVGAVTISHREYISDIFGPAGAGTFQNTVYPINPGVITTFPWLSQIATNYEEYTLKQLIFFYRSTVTDFVATNGQVGSVIMATQYNPSDAPFASKQDAMEYDLAVSGKVSGNVMAGVECDPKQLSGSVGKYVRAGPVRSDDDLKSYDVGNLNMCISNIPQQFANQALGELWVSYTVELRKPKFFVSRGLAIARDAFVAGVTGTGAGGSTGSGLGLIAPVAYAQQNRIGGTVQQIRSDVGTVGNIVQYTFPAQFTGSVILRMTVWPDGVSGGGQVSYYAGGNTTSGTNNTVPFTIPTSMVSMTPINDMWDLSAGAGSGAWAYQRQGAQANYASGDPATLEIHVNVKSPTTAASYATTGGGALTPVVDNTFSFIYVNGSGGIPALSWSLDVSVYNTGFNYPTTGNMILMNSVTDLQESWPPQ